jgi:hypothetical protein
MWLDAPPRTSYPACLAVKAAAEQGRDAALLRRLREGFAVEGRRLDTPDALLAIAGEVDGLQLERFGVDLRSNAIVEAFGTDLERARTGQVPRWEVAARPPRTSSARCAPPGAKPAPAARARRRCAPSAHDDRRGRAVCDLPGPRAPAELWRLALEWRVRPTPPGAAVLVAA